MVQSPTVAARKLLDFIASFESPQGYDAIYGNNQRFLHQKLTTMTIDQVLVAQAHWTARFRSSAAGRYQIVRATLLSLKTDLGLSGDIVFDADLQDRLGLHLLQRRGYDQFIARTLSPNAFGLNLAKEWASLPVLQTTRGKQRIVVRGQSFYSDDGLNHALVAPERVEAVLHQVLVLARQSTPPIAKPESSMVIQTSAGQQALAPVNALNPKQWHRSKAVIGGLIATAVPLVSLFFPAARLIDPQTATDWVMKAIQVGAPIVGGLMAILGRVQATQPIKGSAAVDAVRNALSSAGQSNPWTNVGFAAPGIMNLPLAQIIEEFPNLLDGLQQLGVLAETALPLQAANMDIPYVGTALSKDSPSTSDAKRIPGNSMLTEISAALATLKQYVDAKSAAETELNAPSSRSQPTAILAAGE